VVLGFAPAGTVLELEHEVEEEIEHQAAVREDRLPSRTVEELTSP
jgi:hypothetical protein